MALSPATALAAPGDLDPHFGSHGVHRAPVPSTQVAAGSYDIEATPDGGTVDFRVSVNSNAEGGYDTNYEVVRLSPDGHRVHSFAADGIYRVPPPFEPTGLALGPGASVNLAGSLPAGDGGDRELGVLRLRPDGQPDTGFGDGGIARPGVAGYGVGQRFVANLDGSVVLADDPASDQMRLVKIDDDGALDEAFGTGGLSAVAPADGEFVVADPSGNILLAGTGPSLQTVVARYSASGVLDPAYGEAGIGRLPRPQGEFASTSDVVVDRSGRVLVSSSSSYGLDGGKGDPVGAAHLSRLDASGHLDPGFNATSALGFDPFTKHRMLVGGLALDQRGRILIGGTDYKSNYPQASSEDPLVARLKPDGSLDDRFGVGGRSAFPARGLKVDHGFGAVALVAGSLVAGKGEATARFLITHGRANADADPVSDRRDACPRVPFFARHGIGCPKIRVSLKIHYINHDRFTGSISTARSCRVADSKHGTRGVRVRLMRERPGRDKVIGTDRIRRGEGLYKHVWKIKKNRGGGHFYAEYRKRVRPSLGLCKRARSREITAR